MLICIIDRVHMIYMLNESDEFIMPLSIAEHGVEHIIKRVGSNDEIR